MRRTSTETISDYVSQEAKIELSERDAFQRSVPFLWILGRIGIVLHSNAGYVLLNMFAVLGALLAGFFGGASPSDVVFWIAPSIGDVPAVGFCVARCVIALLVSLPILHSLRIVTCATEDMAQVASVATLERATSVWEDMEDEPVTPAAAARADRRRSVASLRRSRSTSNRMSGQLSNESAPAAPSRLSSGSVACRESSRRRASLLQYVENKIATPRSMQAIRKVFSNRVRKEAQAAAREFKRQYWQHFWRHSIDASSDAHLLEYTVAIVLLATAFTIAVSCRSLPSSAAPSVSTAWCAKSQM